MSFITRHIKWLMLLSGLLTCTMIYAVFAPQAALESTFGASFHSPLADIVVRSWGILITLVGGMLIYAAFNPPSRKLVAAVAATSKSSYATLVLIFGQQYLRTAGWVIGFDSIVAIALFIYLFSTKQAD